MEKEYTVSIHVAGMEESKIGEVIIEAKNKKEAMQWVMDNLSLSTEE